MKRVEVAILGATGAVGQQLVLRLSNHPMFKIAQVSASVQSQGRTYKEAVNWMLSLPLPSTVERMEISPCTPQESIPWTFSALSEPNARTWEIIHRNSGKIVFSASSAHRMLDTVPLIAAQVNQEHIELIKVQKSRYSGAIVTKPNCVVTGLTLTLKALYEQFGLKEVMCHAMQSVSGGGFKGVAALEVLDNLLPLPDEEAKIEQETLKVLGSFKKEKIEPARFSLSARCLRVPITEGHLLAIEIETEKKVAKEQIINAWRSWNNTIPHRSVDAICFIDHPLHPQSRFDRFAGGGMTTVIGSLKKCGVLDWKYLSLTHNTIQGAAGGLVLLAENFKRREFGL